MSGNSMEGKECPFCKSTDTELTLSGKLFEIWECFGCGKEFKNPTEQIKQEDFKKILRVTSVKQEAKDELLDFRQKS